MVTMDMGRGFASLLWQLQLKEWYNLPGECCYTGYRSGQGRRGRASTQNSASLHHVLQKTGDHPASE